MGPGFRLVVRRIQPSELNTLLAGWASLAAGQPELVEEPEGYAMVGWVSEMSVHHVADRLLVDPSRIRLESMNVLDWSSVPSPGASTRWFGPLRVHVGGEGSDGSDGLSIEAQGAFGTGQHPSTDLLLRVLVENRPRDLLDIGTGTGILALAALRLGAERVVATEVDAGALEVAVRNARRNGYDPNGALLTLTGADLSDVGRFSFLVANILPAELCELAPAVVRCMEGRSTLWLSGLRQHHVQAVSEAYRRSGLRILGRRADGDWVAVQFASSW